MKYTILLFCIWMLLLSGCSVQEQNEASAFTVETNDLVSDSLETLFLDTMKKVKEGEWIENLQIEEVQSINDLYVVTFIYDQHAAPYQGVFVAYRLSDEEYEFNGIETAKRNENERLTYFNYLSETTGEIKQSMHIISGYINAKEIDKIYINYVNGKTSALIREGKDTFTDINIGDQAKPETIIALNKNNEVVYNLP